MDKLTAIKIKYDDGTYSDEIPISVLSKNVEWDSTHTLVDVLGSIDVDFTGTIQDQISQLFNEKVSNTQLQNYVASQLNEDVSTWLNNNVDPVGSAVIVDKSLTVAGAAADAERTGNILNLYKNINEGKGNLILNAKIFDGYYANGVYTGTGTEKTLTNATGWCILLIPCKKDQIISISSNMNKGGVQSAWLNSDDLTDIKRVFDAQYNSSQSLCETDWLALSLYYIRDNFFTYEVIMDYFSNLKKDINDVDNKYLNIKNIAEKQNRDITDNLFSNDPNDWQTGLRPESPASYAMFLNTIIPASDKPLYIVIDKDEDLSWSIVFSFYKNGVYQNAVSWSQNTITQRTYANMDFYIGINTNDSSVKADINEFLLKSKIYIGYSPIKNLSDVYPKYIDKYSQYAMIEKEPYAKTQNQKNKYDISDNLFSNFSEDWTLTNNHTVTLKEDFNVTDDMKINIYVKQTSIPDIFYNNGGSIAIRCMDDNNNVLGTLWFYLTLNNYRAIHIRDSFPEGTTKFKIEVTLNKELQEYSISDVIKLEAYISFKDIGSLLTTNINPPNKYIPQSSRTVLNGGYLPDYWLEYLQQRSDDLYTINENIGSHGCSFAFFTDQHTPHNFRKTPLILKWLKENTYINHFISGGDFLTEYDNIDTLLYYTRNFAKSLSRLKVRHVRGNHDNNGMSSSGIVLGTEKYYADFIKPLEKEIIVEPGNTYYYEKLEAQKIIIFYLDTGDFNTSLSIDFSIQINWMQNIIQNLSSEWSVLVIQHIIFDGKDAEDNPKIYDYAQQTIDCLNNITNCNVIALIGGHTHFDYSLISSKGYPIIVTTCDASGPQDSRLTRIEGTTTEQAFDIFNIDTLNKKIYITRIGTGEDREFTY